MLPVTQGPLWDADPLSSGAAPRRSRSSATARLAAFFKRLVQLPQMDFEFALWQMLYLIISPKRVYRTVYYHKRTWNS